MLSFTSWRRLRMEIHCKLTYYGIATVATRLNEMWDWWPILFKFLRRKKVRKLTN